MLPLASSTLLLLAVAAPPVPSPLTCTLPTSTKQPIGIHDSIKRESKGRVFSATNCWEDWANGHHHSEPVFPFTQPLSTDVRSSYTLEEALVQDRREQ